MKNGATATQMKLKPLRFTFYKQGDTLFLNEEPLIKGMPARLFLYMLRTCHTTGRSLFFLSEMRSNRSLGSVANLEARLERLAKRIEERVEGVTLVRQKGCRRLVCECPISLKEL
jgi:adenylate cyclase